MDVQYREQLQSLANWINMELPTDKTTTSEGVVALVKELLTNSYVKDVT